VSWCATFVSWVADQAGYIEVGIFPKFALYSSDVQWFQSRGQWQTVATLSLPVALFSLTGMVMEMLTMLALLSVLRAVQSTLLKAIQAILSDGAVILWMATELLSTV